MTTLVRKVVFNMFFKIILQYLDGATSVKFMVDLFFSLVYQTYLVRKPNYQ